MANKSSLDNVLKAILSIANAEQNSAYSPLIFSGHYNIVTSFILDNLAKIYPEYQDILLPFFRFKRIPITDGYIQLPEEYRNLLGAPSINVNPKGKDCNDPIVIDTENEFKTANLKAGCKTYPIEIVSKNTWDNRTTSEYAFPTYENAIGLFVEGRRIKVCPYDLSSVEVAYVRRENIYRYGYIMQPDDTFLFDLATSVETEWTDSAFSMLFRGCLALYSAYSRDNSLTEYSQILDKLGLF